LSYQLVTGSANVKKETVKYHKYQGFSWSSECNRHESSQTQKNNKTPSPIEQGLMKLDKYQLEKMEKLFRTAHYIAANAKPFTDFEDLCKLQIANKVVLGVTYFNDKSCVQFITHIAGCHFDNLKTLLDNSPFISIYCDGTTDNANTQRIK
jgi:hypothetical protein